jgi:hypothetical protein
MTGVVADVGQERADRQQNQEAGERGRRCGPSLTRFEVALLREALFFHNPTRQRGEVNIVFPSLTLRVLRKTQLQNSRVGV